MCYYYAIIFLCGHMSNKLEIGPFCKGMLEQLRRVETSGQPSPGADAHGLLPFFLPPDCHPGRVLLQPGQGTDEDVMVVFEEGEAAGQPKRSPRLVVLPGTEVVRRRRHMEMLLARAGVGSSYAPPQPRPTAAATEGHGGERNADEQAPAIGDYDYDHGRDDDEDDPPNFKRNVLARYQMSYCSAACRESAERDARERGIGWPESDARGAGGGRAPVGVLPVGVADTESAVIASVDVPTSPSGLWEWGAV